MIIQNNEIIYDLSELNVVADIINRKMKDVKIVLLQGPLGAGKTSLVKSVLLLHGIKEVVSPTFTYMNIYKSNLISNKILFKKKKCYRDITYIL